MALAHLFLCALMATIFAVGNAHSGLSGPRAYIKSDAKSCVDRRCTHACPEFPRNPRGLRNTPERPAATWRRGQRVRVTYTKNNHFGGFMRLSLVPVKNRVSRPWHTRLTLMHGCWATGLHRCARGEDCGTERTRTGWARTLTVPTVFPDGDYVLGYVWYGGTKQGFWRHIDYRTCSFVRIRGGAPVGGTHMPYFEAGSGQFVTDGKCFAAADRVGLCERGMCNGRKGVNTIPNVFKTGSVERFGPADVREAM